MINCTEKFLSDIIQVDVYAAGTPSFAIPAVVPHIGSFSGITLPDSLLRIDYSDTDNTATAREQTISCKQTEQRNGNNIIYIYEVNATFDDGFDLINAFLPTFINKEYNIVLTTAAGEKMLLYTLPNTFSFSKSDSNHVEQSVKITLKSVSDYIKILS